MRDPRTIEKGVLRQRHISLCSGIDCRSDLKQEKGVSRHSALESQWDAIAHLFALWLRWDDMYLVRFAYKALK